MEVRMFSTACMTEIVNYLTETGCVIGISVFNSIKFYSEKESVRLKGANPFNDVCWLATSYEKCDSGGINLRCGCIPLSKS
jgi:hypothetical protein